MIDLRLQNRLVVLTAIGVVILTSSLFTGCGKKTDPGYGPGYEWVGDMRDQIQKEIADPAKVTGLLAVVDQIELSLIDLDAEVKAYYTDLSKLDRQHGATRAEFDTEMKKFEGERDAFFEEMLGYIFDMRQVAGPEDWQKLSDIDKTLYESWQRSYTP